LAFLSANGVELTMAPSDLEAVTLKVAAGDMAKEKLTSWLRSHIGAQP